MNRTKRKKPIIAGVLSVVIILVVLVSLPLILRDFQDIVEWWSN